MLGSPGGTSCWNKAAHLWGLNHRRVAALTRLLQLTRCKWHWSTKLLILTQKQNCLEVWILQTRTSNLLEGNLELVFLFLSHLCLKYYAASCRSLLERKPFGY